MDATTTQSEFLRSLSADPLQREVGLALHWQSAERLRETITSLAYPPGVPLPPEKELALALGISRPTLRQAMSRLAREGVVHSQRGIGSFVLANGIVRPASLASLYDDLVRNGRVPSARVLELGTARADEELSAAFGVKLGSRLVHVRRVRYADGVAVALIDSRLVVPDHVTFERDELERDGLYRLLRRAGIDPVTGHESVSARIATPEELDLLQLDPPAAVMTANRYAFDAAGRGVENSVISYPAGTELFLPELGSAKMRSGSAPED